MCSLRCVALLWVLYLTFSLADPAPGPGAYLSLPTPGTKEVLSPRATAPAFAFGSSQRFIVKQVGPQRTSNRRSALGFVPPALLCVLSSRGCVCDGDAARPSSLSTVIPNNYSVHGAIPLLMQGCTLCVVVNFCEPPQYYADDLAARPCHPVSRCSPPPQPCVPLLG